VFESAAHNEIITMAHARSIKYGLDKDKPYLEKIIKGKEFKKLIAENKDLIEISKPFIKVLYNLLKGSGFSFCLTDKNGIILTYIGDEEIIKNQVKIRMIEGTDMSEEGAGANGMGTSLYEDCSLQISGEEHFLKLFHAWTCSAAIIHDENGNILGCLNLVGNRESVHPHTLGVVVAAVESIEDQIKIKNANDKLIETCQCMDTILNSVSLGIYSVNTDGIIQSFNKEACRILNIKEEELIQKNVESILPNWVEIFEKLKLGKSYEDKELVINNEKIVRGRFDVSANAIKINKEVIGMVVVFKEIQNVFNLVNKYSGQRAVYTFDDIIGESRQIKEVIKYAKKISSSPSTILIEGESGTGKELHAQSIHNYSNRKNNSFVAVNCGAIPKSLIESELFGYEEGAFTGAKKGRHAGKFELANRGTLFLDEIGEMPLDMQVKLLRVLQEGYVTRLGGEKIIPVDVRIIAATNKNLKEEVRKGNFREDLYYRLSVNPITLPPLREREGDLPLLIRYLFRMKTKKLNKNINSIKAEIYTKMMNYNWPGNIRELENCIENIVNLDGQNTAFFNDNEEMVIEKDSSSRESNFENAEIHTLEDVEKNEIVKAININPHNMTQIAKSLGINRSTLYAKIKKYSIKFE